MTSISLRPTSYRHFADSAVIIGPVLGIAAAVFSGNITAAQFAMVALAQWAMLYGLLKFDWSGRAGGGLRWAPVAALALVAGSLGLTARDPSAAKLIYSMLTLGCLIGTLGWAAVRWFSEARHWRPLLLEATALLALAGWLLYGESDWYIIPVTPTGVPHTQPYLVTLSLWWWVGCVLIPAMVIAWLCSQALCRQGRMTIGQAGTLDPATQRNLFASGLIVLLLMALLQNLDFIIPLIGRQIYDGDEFGYLVSTYQLLQHGIFNPPHMPLISLYLTFILAIAGDSTTAILFANGALVVLTAGLLIYALWLISPDMRFVLIGGLLIVSLRTQYLYVWTPLTETLNNMLWAAAIFGLLACVCRPTVLAHIFLGATIGLLLLARSQNIGGIVGLGVAYLLLLKYARGTGPTVSVKRSFILTLSLLIAAALPLFMWGEYRQATIGRFQVMDGRGAEVFLGINMPNVSSGLDANAWGPNVEAWKAQNPNASTADMALAAVRYRIERPAETAYYYWQRTIELLNFRFVSQMGWPVWAGIKTNLQLVLAMFACAALFLTPARWLAKAICIIFFAFSGIFIAIYAEARYRLPMDQLLSIGGAALLAQLLFSTRFAKMQHEGLEQRTPRRLPGRTFVTVIIASISLVAAMRAASTPPVFGRTTSFVAAELRPSAANFVPLLPRDMSDFKDLPTWGELTKTDNASSLQGKLFRARFGLIGSLMRMGNRPAYAGLNIPEDELHLVEATERVEGPHLRVDALAVSFNGATLEEGINQRGVIEIVGRVRPLDAYYRKNFDKVRYVFIDAIHVRCVEETGRQRCTKLK